MDYTTARDLYLSKSKKASSAIRNLSRWDEGRTMKHNSIVLGIRYQNAQALAAKYALHYKNSYKIRRIPPSGGLSHAERSFLLSSV